jgi:hypothetical protein
MSIEIETLTGVDGLRILRAYEGHQPFAIATEHFHYGTKDTYWHLWPVDPPKSLEMRPATADSEDIARQWIEYLAPLVRLGRSQEVRA